MVFELSKKRKSNKYAAQLDERGIKIYYFVQKYRVGGQLTSLFD
jgi:hypothetical protein